MVVYSDKMYKAADIHAKFGFDPCKNDLSRIPSWENFVKTMNRCMMKQFYSLDKGGRMAVLVGDIKKKGRLYSMIFELAKPGTVEQCIIKAQHNCVSDRNTYSGNFVPIEHEYVLIVRKDNALVFNIQYAQNIEVDARNLNTNTWRDVVASVFEEKGKTLKLDELYKYLEGHKKAERNQNWREKIRQTLQINPNVFNRVDSGVWALAA